MRQRLLPDARRDLLTHCMSECPTRSYSFRRPDGGSRFAYTLTWSPGNLVLAGDMGSLVLVHYHAMATFRRALSWAATSEYDYLMEKSTAERKFSADDTVDYIVQHANEEPLDWILGTRKYRHPKVDATPEEVAASRARYGKRSGGFLQEWRSYRKSSDEGELLDLWEGNPFVMAEHRDWRQRATDDVDKFYEYADCWGAWLRIWKELHGFLYSPNSRRAPSPRMVLSAAGRRRLKKDIRREVDTAKSAADFCCAIGLDGYYGYYQYEERTVWQIQAIQQGCRMILASLPDEAAPETPTVVPGMSHATV